MEIQQLEKIKSLAIKRRELLFKLTDVKRIETQLSRKIYSLTFIELEVRVLQASIIEDYTSGFIIKVDKKMITTIRKEIEEELYLVEKEIGNL